MPALPTGQQAASTINSSSIQFAAKIRTGISDNVRFRNAVSDREHRVAAGGRVFCRMIELNPLEPLAHGMQ
jgi:hypothetical protein